MKPTCPSCGSEGVVKNGRIHSGKQNFRCKACYRQFVEKPQTKRISQSAQDLIDFTEIRRRRDRTLTFPSRPSILVRLHSGDRHAACRPQLAQDLRWH
ncbi:MAG: IS1 family transposase [Cyanobacteria bacterium P01_D01_bin.123]